MLVVRPERPEDERAVVVAHIAAWRAGCEGNLPTDILAEAARPTESYIEGWARRRHQLLASRSFSLATLVGEVDATVVGHITYGQAATEPDAGQVFSCYVHPDHWGTGIADALLDAALSTLPQSEVHLWVHPENHRARRFYHRHGFRPEDGQLLAATGYLEILLALHRYAPDP